MTDQKLTKEIAFQELKDTLVKTGLVPFTCYIDDDNYDYPPPDKFITDRLIKMDKEDVVDIYKGFVNRLQTLGVDVKYDDSDYDPYILYPDVGVVNPKKNDYSADKLARYYNRIWSNSRLYAQLRITEAGNQIDWGSPPKYLKIFINRVKRDNPTKKTVAETYNFFLFTDVQRQMKDTPFGCSEFKNPITNTYINDLVPKSTHIVEITPKGLVCWDLIGIATYICCMIHKYGEAMMPSSYIPLNFLTFGLLGFALKGLLASNNDPLVAQLQKMYLRDVSRTYNSQELVSTVNRMFQDPETVFSEMITKVAEWKETFQDLPIKSYLDLQAYTDNITFHVENIQRILADSMKKFQNAHKEQKFPPHEISFWLQSAQTVTIPSHIDYSPDATKIERFLASATTEKQKADYQTLIENLKYVSFKDLLSYLQIAVVKLLKSLYVDGKYQPWAAVVLSDADDVNVQYTKDKSNVWIFRLILKFIPDILHQLPQTVIIKQEQLRRVPLHLVFFDDIVYTGTQLTRIVQHVGTRTTQKKITYHAIVACAPEKLMVEQKYFPNTMHKGCTIVPLNLFGRNAYPVYAQHKLPDSLSSFDEEMAQVVRNCNTVGGLRMNQCPIVPYKQPDGWGPDIEDDDDDDDNSMQESQVETEKMDFEFLDEQKVALGEG